MATFTPASAADPAGVIPCRREDQSVNYFITVAATFVHPEGWRQEEPLATVPYPQSCIP